MWKISDPIVCGYQFLKSTNPVDKEDVRWNDPHKEEITYRLEEDYMKDMNKIMNPTNL